MKRLVTFFMMSLALSALAQPVAIEATLLTSSTGRQQGFLSKQDVFQKAVLLKSPTKQDTALLVFRGWPGIARLQASQDWQRNLNFMARNAQLFLDAGISIVVMDCPSDQQAMLSTYDPASCDDGYRSSKQHAEDVTSMMDKLNKDHGLSKFYVFGHSYGSLSSKWLAHHLGSRLEGSIHSAAQTTGGRDRFTGFGNSAMSVDVSRLAAPSLHIHHEGDGCASTPYATVRGYAKDNLVTVRGGSRNGDPCGGGHLHSYEGREIEVSKAIIAWISDKEVRALVGAPD